MPNDSYDFDPCTIDGSDRLSDDDLVNGWRTIDLDDDENDDVTLDNWRPVHTLNRKKIIPSQWRKEKIGDNFNQEPSLDDLAKIKMYLKKKAPDSDIMEAFGINAETLVAIKQDKYSPVSGIHLDNMCKIYNQFVRLENNIDNLTKAVKFIAKTMYIDPLEYKQFKKEYINKKIKKLKDDLFCDKKDYDENEEQFEFDNLDE